MNTEAEINANFLLLITVLSNEGINLPKPLLFMKFIEFLSRQMERFVLV